jgi:hypothetical protein
MRLTLLCVLVLSAQGTGCGKQESETRAGASSAAASVQAAPPSSATASAATKAKGPSPVAGDFVGSYDARHYLIEMSKKEGAVREWEADKGDENSGKGKLALRIAADGSVSGSASGPLGDLSIVGELEGEWLRLRLTPANPEKQPAFTGHLLAERKGDAFKGRIQASSGDSLTVRDAPVELRPKGAAEPSEKQP